MYKIEIDTHTHTIASTHAFSTVTEMANEAKIKGLKGIAITDHGPSLEDSPHKWHFYNMRILPDFLNSVRIIKGVELSLIDELGNIDLEEEYLSALEWVNVSIHYPICQKENSYEKITQSYLKVLENPYINCISHMGTPRFFCDYEKIIKKAKEFSKVIEINNNSKNIREGSFPNCIEIAKLCKKHEVNVVVSSDAHFHNQLGDYKDAFEILKNADFPEKLILNSSYDRFIEYVSKVKKGM